MSDNNVRPAGLKRHFWIWPLLIGFGLMTAGEIIGIVMMIPFSFFDVAPMWKFTAEYALFAGIPIAVLVYCAIFEKKIFRCFFPRGNRDRSYRNGSIRRIFYFITYNRQNASGFRC